MKIPSSNLGRTCCVQKLLLTFRTIFVRNMFILLPMFCKKKSFWQRFTCTCKYFWGYTNQLLKICSCHKKKTSKPMQFLIFKPSPSTFSLSQCLTLVRRKIRHFFAHLSINVSFKIQAAVLYCDWLEDE